MGHLINHGMPVSRLIAEGLVPGENFRYHTMAEVEKRDWDAVMEDIIAEAIEGPEYLFISLKHYLSPLTTDHGQRK